MRLPHAQVILHLTCQYNLVENGMGEITAVRGIRRSRTPSQLGVLSKIVRKLEGFSGYQITATQYLQEYLVLLRYSITKLPCGGYGIAQYLCHLHATQIGNKQVMSAEIRETVH